MWFLIMTSGNKAKAWSQKLGFIGQRTPLPLCQSFVPGEQ